MDRIADQERERNGSNKRLLGEKQVLENHKVEKPLLLPTERGLSFDEIVARNVTRALEQR